MSRCETSGEELRRIDVDAILGIGHWTGKAFHEILPAALGRAVVRIVTDSARKSDRHPAGRLTSSDRSDQTESISV